MRTNVASSIGIFDAEREYHRVIPGYISTQLDNYTDSWMIGNAVFSDEGTAVWKRALTCTRAEYGQGPLDGLIRYVNGEDGYRRMEYTRYWHGYLVALKPLLLFLDYADLRFMNVALELLLAFAVFGELNRRRLCREGVAYALSLLFMMPVVAPLSIQFSIVYYVSSLAALTLLKGYERIEDKKQMLLYFQLIGMITSFSDLLTYPIAALGIPLVCLMILENPDSCRRVWEKIKRIVCCSVSWGFGYGAMWAGKWLLSTIVLKDNIILDAFLQIQMRSSHKQGDEAIGISDAWLRNVELYFRKPYLVIIALCLAAVMIVFIKNKRTAKDFISQALPFIVIACMPFAWYAVAVQHSYEHHWFTFRGLTVSAFAGLCIWAGGKGKSRGEWK